FARVAAEFLAIEPDKRGEIHIPHDALEALCRREPARYEALLFEGLERTTCDPCRAEAGRILVESYGDRHRARGVEIAKQTLATISQRKNAEDRYRFAWSGGERWEDGTPAYVGWVLRTFGAEAHQAVFEHVEATKVFDLDLAEVIAKQMGQDG